MTGSNAGGATGTRRLGAPLLLIFVTLLVFREVAGFGFVAYDDSVHLHRNPYLDPPRLENALRLWRQSYFSEYVPLTNTLFALESAASRVLGRSFDPRVFHATSLLLHAFCALAVFALLRRLVEREFAALAGALLFALHPLQVESVAWVSETRGLLAGFFSLLALHQYVRFAEPTGGEAGRTRALRYALATFLFALALFSKPSAVSLPFIAFALDVGVLRRRPFPGLRALGPWVALAGVFVWVASSQQNEYLPEPTALVARPLVAFDAIAFYAEKLIVPLALAADYGRTPTQVLGGNPPWVGLGIVAALLAVALTSTGRRAWGTAATVFVAGLIPVLGLVPFAFQRTSTVADRYAYLSLLGAALALAWLLDRNRSRWLAAGVATALVGLAIASSLQVRVWRDSRSLWNQAVVVNPKSFRGHHGLGLLAQARGDYQHAVDHYETALATHGFSEAHNNLGVALIALGRDERARQEFQRAVAADWEYPKAHANLGKVLSKLGHHELAAQSFETAARQDPNDADALFRWAQTDQKLGNEDKALQRLGRVLALAPDHGRAWLVSGDLLERRGAFDVALDAYRSAVLHSPRSAAAHQGLVGLLLRLDRSEQALRHADALARENRARALGHVLAAQVHAYREEWSAAINSSRAALHAEPESVEAASHLAWFLATRTSDPESAAEAVRLAERLCEPPGDTDPELLDTLAAAYAAAGRFDEAARTALGARRTADRAGRPELAAEIAAREALYRAGRPYASARSDERDRPELPSKP